MIDPIGFYKCLADDTRLKSLLLISLKGELCVCDLTDALTLSQPKVSRHLAELRKCGILLDERRGKWVFYKISPQLPNWAVEVLKTTQVNGADYLAEALAKLEATQCTNDCASDC